MKPYQQENLLAKYPKHIPTENILQYFLHIYEYNWTSPTFESVTNMTEYLIEMESQFMKEWTIEKRWWGYLLAVQLINSKFHNFVFGHSTIEHVLKRGNDCTESELELYSNLISGGLKDNFGNMLSIRPLEMKNAGTDTIILFPDLFYYEEKHEEILNEWRKVLKEEHINKKYVNKYFRNERSARKEAYSDDWKEYYELFIIYIMSLDPILSEVNEYNKDEFNKLVNELIENFFANSQINVENILTLSEMTAPYVLQRYTKTSIGSGT